MDFGFHHGQSARKPSDSFTTFSQRASSDLMCAANRAGDEAIASAPS